MFCCRTLPKHTMRGPPSVCSAIIGILLFAIFMLAAAQAPTAPTAQTPPETAPGTSRASGNALQLYNQCGGKSQCEAYECIDDAWPGVSCPAGSSCQRQHEWYWQCRPGTGSVQPAAAGTPSAANTTAGHTSLVADRTATAPVVGAPAASPEETATSGTGPLSARQPAPNVTVPQEPVAVEAVASPTAANNTETASPAVEPAAVRLGAVTIPPAVGEAPPAFEVPPAAAPAAASANRSNATIPVSAAAAAPPPGAPPILVNERCPPYTDIQKFRTTNFADTLNTTVAISPLRPSTDRPRGAWIPGRATYYGTSQNNEAAHVECGEPAGQFGVLEQGACGFTNGDGSLVYPADVYAANADANEDYPGSCGRCYQVRCRSGVPENNGRPLRISDLIYYRPLPFLTDDQGRSWPGNPQLEQDLFYVQCWDDNAAITIRVGDSCPCKYNIKETGEVRTQFWCCGGQNHFDLSYFAFQKLAHPVYGVMPMEYRPVDCVTNQPLDPIPGFVSKAIYRDDLGAGWGWRTYAAKNTVLLAQGAGLGGATAVCGTLSQDGAMGFFCRECTRPGYQPFAGAARLQFWIRSNTPASAGPFASSTPAGELPGLKIFMSQDGADPGRYCGAEVLLGNTTLPADRSGDWFFFSIPLAAWRCDEGSVVGGLAGVDRVDFQNVEVRDADVCLDDVILA